MQLCYLLSYIINFTGLFLYSQKTEDVCLSEVFKGWETSGIKWIRQRMFFSHKKLVLMYNFSRSYAHFWIKVLLKRKMNYISSKRNFFLPSVISGQAQFAPKLSGGGKVFWNWGNLTYLGKLNYSGGGYLNNKLIYT